MRKLLVLLALVSFGAWAQPSRNVDPASQQEAITPSDSTSLTRSNGELKYRAIFVEGAGDVSITDVNGTTVVYTVPAGTLLPFRPLRVNSTGTTATGITGWW